MSIQPPSLVGLKLGNFRLERVLGKGRMGVVYLASDEALLRPTAVKVLAWTMPDPANHDPEAWLLAEARHIARINHPSVIQVYGVARHGPHCYIAMEYVEGVSAERIVADRGPLEPLRATEILLNIAGALHAAHACDVIHRDVKPANILIHADGTAKLGDFGLAQHRPRALRPGYAPRVGTPHYTAPELWRSEPATPSTDVYALGATYHFLLTGHTPFDAVDLAGMANAHLHAPLPDPRERVPALPEACADLVRACMAKLPKDRPASAQALAWEARGLLRHLAGQRRSRGFGSGSRPIPAELKPRDAAATFFGFERSPFTSFDEVPDLESFSPFGEVAREIRAALDEAPGSTIVLTGERASGRSRLVHGLLEKPPRRGPVAWIEVAVAGTGRSLAQRACSAFGAEPDAYSTTSRSLEGLLHTLQGVCTKAGCAATLVIDSVLPTQSFLEDLSSLARAARATEFLSLVVIDGPAAPELLLRGGVQADALRVVALPPLDPAAMLRYLQRRLREALPAGAPPALWTPDAAILLAHRTKGNLARANRVAAGALQVAARRGSRVITSWDVWLAGEGSASLGDGASQPPPPAPAADWPGPEILAVLEAGRRQLGVGPRPLAAEP